MKITFKILLTPLLVILPGLSYGQGYISSDYMPASTLKDDAGNKYGSGDLLILSSRYTLPFSVRHNEKGQVTAWSATLNCSYGILNNKGPAKELNPDNILNSSLNISHIRPLSDKWSIIASLGAGVYASPNEITMKSVLANGAVVFVYKLRNNLDLGIGGGLTNSYGIPMILPMVYFSWRNTGKYEFKVDMSSGIKISAATWLNKKFKVELTANYGVGLSLAYDSRDVLTNPHKGYYLNITQCFRPKFLGNDYAFSTTDLRTSYYHPVWKGGLLAGELRGTFNFGNPSWAMMALLGNSYSMRGYYEGRYRDKHKIEGQVELRQHVWKRNGVVVWIGAGTVFNKFSALCMDRVLPNYGIGYRWEFKKNVNVRLDYGFGKNGQSGFIFNINEAF